MNRLIVTGVLAVASCCAQQLDLSSLDKLEGKAKSVNRVNLDDSQLKAAAEMSSDAGNNGRKEMMSNLRAVQVRNYEFSKPGQYVDSDIDPVRKQIAAMPGCSKIIESKEDGEHSEIYSCAGEKNQGMAIIDSEPTEISVVFIRGPVKMGDLGKLHGLMGMPRMDDEIRERDRARERADRDRDRAQREREKAEREREKALRDQDSSTPSK